MKNLILIVVTLCSFSVFGQSQLNGTWNTGEDNTQVGAGRYRYHTVEIKPSNREFNIKYTPLERELNKLKFTVGTNL